MLNDNLLSFGCGRHIPNYTACSVHLCQMPHGARTINSHLISLRACAPALSASDRGVEERTLCVPISRGFVVLRGILVW